MIVDCWKDNWIGFTCGVYDLLHAGHILALKEIREQCMHLIVGLQSDPTLDRSHKNKPIQSLEERLIQLQACRYVSTIWVYDTEKELYDYLRDNKAGIHKRFIGEDWKDKKYTGHDLPMRVIFNSRDHKYSSTELRARIIFRHSYK